MSTTHHENKLIAPESLNRGRGGRGDRAERVDVAGLADTLARSVEGEVRFDAGSRALYATDASNYRQVPIGVVVPRSREDVIAVIEACRRFGAPIVARAG